VELTPPAIIRLGVENDRHDFMLTNRVVMKKVIPGVLALLLTSCLPIQAPAVDRIRIDDLEPSIIDRGGEFVLRGRNFSCNDGSYTLQTRVQMHRGNRFTHAVDLPLSVVLDEVLRARVPAAVAPGVYTIYVVTTSASGRLLCRSNPRTLTIRQPAPPATAADPLQVINNPCAARNADENEQGIGSPSCPYPMRHIWVSENLDNRTREN
jgi:hypothetical protein